MSKTRRYDIGHGVIVTDDGYYLRAEWKPDKYSTKSVGIRRPPLEVGETVEAIFSLDGRFFYLPVYVEGPHGHWMSTESYPVGTLPCDNGLACCIEFTRCSTGEKYERKMLPFSCFNVQSYGSITVPVDDMIKDYLYYCITEDRQQEKRFNHDIAFTGRNLKWILDKIGPWVPFPPDPEPVVLI